MQCSGLHPYFNKRKNFPTREEWPLSLGPASALLDFLDLQNFSLQISTISYRLFTWVRTYLSLPIVISLLFLSFSLHHAFFIKILITKHNLFLFPFPSCPSDIPLTTYLNDKFTRSPCPVASGSVRFCKPWGGLRYAP